MNGFELNENLKSNNYLNEINSNFDKEIEVLTGKENAMGIIETIKKITREEGKKEGLTSTVENLLKRGMSIKEVSEITTL